MFNGKSVKVQSVYDLITTINDLSHNTNVRRIRIKSHMISEGGSCYEVIWMEKSAESNYMLEILHSLQKECETEQRLEEQDALDYAIGAIKTLQDMGALEND